jgi:hypothetical protein
MSVISPSIKFEVQDMPLRHFDSLRQALRAGFMTPLQPPMLEDTVKIDSVSVSGDLACVVATWIEREDQHGEAIALRELHGVDILERGEDRQWLITRSLYYWRLPQ